MKKNFDRQNLLILLLGLAAAGAVFVVSYNRTHTGSIDSQKDTAFRPKAKDSAPAKSSTPAPSSEGEEPKATTPTTTPAASDSGLITISSPAKNSTITSGTIVNGTAKIAAGEIYYRVKGNESGQLAAFGPIKIEGSTTAVKPYSFELVFSNGLKSATDTGVLEVYSLSTDKTETNITSISVNLK